MKTNKKLSNFFLGGFVILVLIAISGSINLLKYEMSEWWFIFFGMVSLIIGVAFALVDEDDELKENSNESLSEEETQN